MRRKILALLMAAGMMVLGIVGCGQTGENQNAGNQEQTEGQTEEIEAKEPGTQGSGQSASSQENAGVQGSHSAESTAPENTGAPVVYMTTDISSDGLMAIYEALGASPEGNIAVKLSTGEPGSNYLRTDLIGELVQSL
ncbi:MAG: hypothetical protein K2N00_04895, partial [Lachnospiraceae bacterium]|nr:hypothetical protein [Lachnospiraceae bacterium]